jgi:hypothetical protein
VFASAWNLPTEALIASPALDAPGVPESWGATALVIDLPGDESVAVGLALARRGFRPVPLFNGTTGPSSVVDMKDLIIALGAGSQVLRDITIPPNAPPAFLLDASRMGAILGSLEGRYDNRWVVLPQDFPSATFLQSQGLREATLICSGTLKPAKDLAHVLLRWKEGGLKLNVLDLSERRFEADVSVPVPNLFRLAWYAAVTFMGLRRSNVGGFGATVPEETRGGFYG